MIRTMSPSALSDADRRLDELDPDHSLASRGRSVGGRVAGSLAEADRWLDELGGADGDVIVPSPVAARAPRPPVEVDDDALTIIPASLSVQDFLRASSRDVAPSPVQTPVVPSAPSPIETSPEPELSFDELFDQTTPAPAEPDVLSSFSSGSTAIAASELDAEELAALDSLEIILDD